MLECVVVRPFSQEPALRLVSIHLKYGPWKDAFIKAFRCAGVCGGGAQARASRLLAVLQETCRAMHNRVDEQAPWVENVGHCISFVSGPLAFLTRLGVLQRAARGDLLLGMPGPNSMRRLCNAREQPRIVAELSAWVHLADALGEPMAPQTCQEWVTAQRCTVDIFRQNPVKGMVFGRQVKHIVCERFVVSFRRVGMLGFIARNARQKWPRVVTSGANLSGACSVTIPWCSICWRQCTLLCQPNGVVGSAVAITWGVVAGGGLVVSGNFIS